MAGSSACLVAVDWSGGITPFRSQGPQTLEKVAKDLAEKMAELPGFRPEAAPLMVQHKAGADLNRVQTALVKSPSAYGEWFRRTLLDGYMPSPSHATAPETLSV